MAWAQPAGEYQVKAVFLFRFAQFVEWPPEAFSDAQAPIVIGVLGEDPFGGFLDEAVAGERVNRRPLEVRRYRRMDEIGGCHILFIAESEEARPRRILKHPTPRLQASRAEGQAPRSRARPWRASSMHSAMRSRIRAVTARASSPSRSAGRIGGP